MCSRLTVTFKWYSESCTDTIDQETTIEGYQYGNSLDRAFQLLISENFNNYILEIGCIAVAIFVKVTWASKYSILMQGISTLQVNFFP